MALVHAVKPQSRLFETGGQRFFWEYQATEMATWGWGVGLFHFKPDQGGYVQVAIADQYPIANIPAPYTKDVAGQRLKLVDDCIKLFNEQLDILAPKAGAALYPEAARQAMYDYLTTALKLVDGRFTK